MISSSLLPVFLSLCLPLSTASSLSAILPLKATRYGTAFDAEIQVGDQTFTVLVDTGSASAWVLAHDWKCYKARSLPSGDGLAREDCNYGNNTYLESPTFEPITDSWYGEHFGSGNDIGTLGLEQVTLGGITIDRQEVAFVHQSADVGDGINSGALGLGYPVLAAVHPAAYTANSSVDLLLNRWKFNTVFNNLMKQGVASYFAFALERTPLNQEFGFGGYLTLGTLPPVPHSAFTTVPVEPTKSIPASFTNGTNKISEWTVTVDAMTYSNETSSTPFQVVVDTGNWQNLVPAAISSKINAAFDPPGVWDKSSGYYKVACNATPPAGLGYRIGGTLFTMQGEDMIWRAPEGGCYSSVGPSATGEGGLSLSFLGDAFLKNVVAVFDVGKTEMRFAQRVENTVMPSTGEAGVLHAPMGLLALVVVVLMALV